MAEYIEKEAALEICETEYQDRLRKLDYCGDTVAWNIGSEIKALPTADVAPVVRCEACKHYRRTAPTGGLCYLHTEPCTNERGYKGVAVCTEADDFCSYGKRKEEWLR